MTLVVSIIGEKSIWMVTDRRLSCRGRRPNDFARKMLFLETHDGVAILGYAGLGATAKGTEPCDWMSRVLRGRNMTMEQSLSVLAEAVRSRLPSYLDQIQVSGHSSHHIIIPAYVNGEERIYSIGLVGKGGGGTYRLNLTRYTTGTEFPMKRIKPRVAIGGSAEPHLLRDRDWIREVFRLVKAHDAGRIKPHTVANFLAKLNSRVAKKENTVGERCIVAWRFKGGGGGHEFFSGVARDANPGSNWIPTMARGTDMSAVVRVLSKVAFPHLQSMLNGIHYEPDMTKVNEELAKLPQGPDDSLS